MLRTGQMILARALLKHVYPDNVIINHQERIRINSKYNQVLKWFSDYQSKEHLYGIHQIVHMKKAMEKKIRQKALENYARRKQQLQQQQQQRYGKNSVRVRIDNYSDSSSDSEDEWDNVEEWLAPTKISNVLRQLVKNQNLDDLEMYVPNDGVIYREYINQLCNPYYFNNYKNNDQNNQNNLSMNQSPPSRVPSEVFNHPLSVNDDDQDYYHFNPNKWKSLIIMIPLKLGVDRINTSYIRKLKSILSIPQSLGFIGGKPKQSFYFIGFQDDQVIYLDPHFVQDTVDPSSNNYSETFCGCIPQKMSFSNIDPSLSVGFYCKDKSSFDDLCDRLSKLENDEFPIISISNKLPDYQLEVDLVEDFYENLAGATSVTTANQNFNNNIANLNPNMNTSVKFGSFDTDDEFQLVNNNKFNNNNNNNSINNKQLPKSHQQSTKQQKDKEQFSAIYSHPPNFSSDDEIDDFTFV
ncbi:hypothetical protein DICPUDRAFT_99299 [Dictyostelium purpureum]|uniref:Cysteine protease n=1 Tax=Dictyostelium purpureum TaxID=5786 RepID=F0ZY21_DICPU|nr:uncharacterized protein DICPUDRAFT_99299 [Dictyostelium purpureum]EGC31168.1 hypothetical protein DICPUDRAFT_99299 [Dictyostelium purpureum]|eukprot:XP_003292315.1 hypothetical protein DICPUDRAFT_99299 [Dictyostelium purpureum]